MAPAASAAQRQALLLYRALLRECRRVSCVQSLHLREPIQKEWGSYGMSTPGLGRQHTPRSRPAPSLLLRSQWPPPASLFEPLLPAAV